MINSHTYKRIHKGVVQKFAFTLAEVLIVLGIIGIVAEMTIPTLVNTTQNAEYKSGLKKAYSVLSQAQIMLATDNSGDFSGALSSCDTSVNTATGATCLKNAFKTKLLYMKDCDGGSAFGVCSPARADVKTLNNGDNGDQWAYYDTMAGLLLNDGMSVVFDLESPSCKQASGVASAPYRCGWLTVDVNGLKRPNTWGKDMYHFWILPNSIIPVSTVTNSDQHACDGSTSDTGHLCSSTYLYN